MPMFAISRGKHWPRSHAEDRRQERQQSPRDGPILASRHPFASHVALPKLYVSGARKCRISALVTQGGFFNKLILSRTA